VSDVISGRDTPRTPGPVTHDVRFYGCLDRSTVAGYAVLAVCEPCAWSTHLANGHTDQELWRMAAMHRGEVPA
jgi:hypothetical protein